MIGPIYAESYWGLHWDGNFGHTQRLRDSRPRRRSARSYGIMANGPRGIRLARPGQHLTGAAPMHPASEASLWIDRQLPAIAEAAKRLGHCSRIRPEWTDEVRLILGEVIRINLIPPSRRPSTVVEFDRCTKREGGPSKAREPVLRTLRHLRYVALAETASGYEARPGPKLREASSQYRWRLIDILYGPHSAMAKLTRGDRQHAADRQ
jgi:hypothetical protein